jgi:hypothetical protein
MALQPSHGIIPMPAYPPTWQALRLLQPSEIHSSGIKLPAFRIIMFLQSLVPRLFGFFHDEEKADLGCSPHALEYWGDIRDYRQDFSFKLVQEAL